MSNNRKRIKTRLATEAFHRTHLGRVVIFIQVASVIVLVGVSTLGWIWLDWSAIWRIQLFLSGLFILGIVTDLVGAKLMHHTFSDYFEYKAKNKEPSNEGYTGYFRERLQKLADKESNQK